MPDFIPVLIAAVLLMTVLLIIFGGGFVPIPETTIANSRTILLGSNVLIANSIGESMVAVYDTRVSNGVFSREDSQSSFTVPDPADVAEGILRFDVLNTNLYGNLMFYVNGNLVYNQPAKNGFHSFVFNNSAFSAQNTLEIRAESSGWKIWAPTVYILQGNLSVNYLGERFQSFDFNLTKHEILNLGGASLRIFGTSLGTGNLIAQVNGVEVYRGSANTNAFIPTDVLTEGENTLELSSETNSRYDLSSIQIILSFG